MAYVLGYIFADGCIMKHRYRLKIASSEKNHLKKVLQAMESNYPILTDKKGIGRLPVYSGIVDSKKIYFDLVKLGLIPRKSKVITFPNINGKYFFHFLRGYLDGDGSVYYDKPHIDRGNKKYTRLNTCFTCGSSKFLNTIQKLISNKLKVSQQKLSKNHTAFKLRYSTQDSLRLLKQIYKSDKFLKLNRKYKMYKDYISPKRKKI